MTGKMGIDLFIICTEMCSWLWKINPEAFDFSKSSPIHSILVELAFLQLCSVYKRVRINLRRVPLRFIPNILLIQNEAVLPLLDNRRRVLFCL